MLDLVEGFFKVKEDSTCGLLIVKSASGLYRLSGEATRSLSTLAEIQTGTPVRSLDLFQTAQ
jgi:hypothetical protein